MESMERESSVALDQDSTPTNRLSEIMTSTNKMSKNLKKSIIEIKSKMHKFNRPEHKKLKLDRHKYRNNSLVKSRQNP